GFVDVLEEGEQRVEVALGDRVILVVMTARAFEGEAEEGGAHRVDAVDDVGDPELLLDDAPLLVLHVQPVERGSQALVLRGAGAARKASTSAVVGGSPVRSSVTRRISASLGASGAGDNPSRASRARTSRSIPLRDRSPRPAAGSGRRWGGTNAQCRPQLAPC